MTDQADLNQLANAELQRLQRQHRALQLQLHSLLDEKSYELKKQNNLISVLQREHGALKEEIDTLDGGIHSKKNANYEKKLSILQKQQNALHEALNHERTTLWELDGHLKKLAKETEGLRKNELPDSCYKDKICKIQKSAMKLENRLDVVNKKCSDVLSENRKLRKVINHMLQDRTNFNEMWQAKVTQFSEGKKYIMDLIDQSTLAFDQREELCNKLQVLKDRTENDKVVHIQEMREMQRRLDHDAKLQKFFDIKGQKRLNPELEQREVDKKLAKKENFERQLVIYKSITGKIQKLYQESDATNLITQFKNQEEENFALFNYVNELSYEVEVLNFSTQELCDEIERQKAQQAKKELKIKTEAIEYLESEIQRLKALSDKALKKLNELQMQLQVLLHGIGDIFKQLKCDNAPILNVLNTKTSLTVQNVKLFVGVIERRINLMMSNISVDDNSTKILAKKDRVPKFNVKDTAKIKT